MQSGNAVSSALQKAGYEVVEADPANDFSNLAPLLDKVNVVFPALHGQNGEDGKLQKFLEKNKVKFVGSGSLASELCFDKARYGNYLSEKKILIPETKLINYDEFLDSKLSAKPFVLKPNFGGSSIDNIIVRKIGEFNESAVKNIFRKYKKLLLQELITGIEITVGILINESLPVIEIVPPKDKEFDYQNKYNGATEEICPPENVESVIQNAAQDLAKQIHELCGCRDLSRTDFMINEAGRMYVIETNTMPGLTDQSLLPKAAAAAGIDMVKLCDSLVKAALERN